MVIYLKLQDLKYVNSNRMNYEELIKKICQYGVEAIRSLGTDSEYIEFKIKDKLFVW